MSDEEREKQDTTGLRLGEQFKRIFWLWQMQSAIVWAILLALVAIVATIYMYQASRIATVGRQTQILQIDLDKLKRQNEEVEQKIAEAQSLTLLQERAVRLGFVQAAPEDIEYLIVADFPMMAEEAMEASASIKPLEISKGKPIESMVEALWMAMLSSLGY